MKPGSDINTLQATGDIVSINKLINLLILHLPDSNFCISDFQAPMPAVKLKCSFATWGGFPKDLFSHITSRIDKGRKLELEIWHDALDKDVNERFVYSEGKWDFQDSCTGIKIHDIAKDVVHTTGAYIIPFSYKNKTGKDCFAWMVTGFTEGTYCDGEEISAVDSASFLEGLTPPAEDEERSNDYIITALDANGLKRLKPNYYHRTLDNGDSDLYVFRVDDISNIDTLKFVENTLDLFLLGSKEFSPASREILVEAFGRDMESIFLSEIGCLYIKVGQGNYWTAQEKPRSGEEKENLTLHKIPYFLKTHNLTSVILDVPYWTELGTIKAFYPQNFEYDNGTTGYYQDLKFDLSDRVYNIMKHQVTKNQQDNNQ